MPPKTPSARSITQPILPPLTGEFPAVVKDLAASIGLAIGSRITSHFNWVMGDTRNLLVDETLDALLHASATRIVR